MTEGTSRRELLQLSLAVTTGALAAPISPALAQDAFSSSWPQHDGKFKEEEFADFKVFRIFGFGSFDRILQVSASGIKYKDVVVGEGSSPSPEDTVRAHYAGYLLDGSLFDSSYRPALFPFSLITPDGPPVAFRLGRGSLIPGFEEALLGMKTGGKRVVLIPPKLAYGERGSGPIPPNSPLVFYLELRTIGGGMTL
ncbi:FKBP-type peptidyl-prolyl cis-trans isomerase [Guillardia theta CCMP2712]|uniref:peptidylprolyl isomerase n=1 Tax=Guillardia theta (strain CCMP2712) TaxID=905079 RepID=L1J077_GUITC|nr:FKBP-type peptidyl-prolyl cis-trans isomerase [Guillardia theta CCMP2712]EKX41886.1 FKBP-type peptidyl-prolyl cis-trans isomerase [Guillardia theta CCMP2712]|eukprot:XP_005828866.1 FKBP-type peptidyl-prolyl cis-trans isomerase [Guillardia theta CCMP2712]